MAEKTESRATSLEVQCLAACQRSLAKLPKEQALANLSWLAMQYGFALVPLNKVVPGTSIPLSEFAP